MADCEICGKGGVMKKTRAISEIAGSGHIWVYVCDDCREYNNEEYVPPVTSLKPIILGKEKGDG